MQSAFVLGTPVWLLTAFASAACLAVVGGAVLALWGIVLGRRMPKRRTCAKCGYDLGGAMRTVCTECGADLLREGAVRDTRRVVAWLPSLAGVALAAVGVWVSNFVGAWGFSFGSGAEARIVLTRGWWVIEGCEKDARPARISPERFVEVMLRNAESGPVFDEWVYPGAFPVAENAYWASDARLEALRDAALEPSTRSTALVVAISVLASTRHFDAIGASRLSPAQVALVKECIADAVVLEPALAFDPRVKPRLLDFDRLGDDTGPVAALQRGLALRVDPSKPCAVQMASETAAAVATMDFTQLACTLVRGPQDERRLEPVASGADIALVPGADADLSRLEIRVRGSLGLVFSSRRLVDASGAARSTTVLVPVELTVDRVELEQPLAEQPAAAP